MARKRNTGGNAQQRVAASTAKRTPSTRQEIVEDLRSVAAGGKPGGNRINEAYAAYRARKEQEKPERAMDEAVDAWVQWNQARARTPQYRMAQDEAAEREASGYVSPENYAASIRANKRAADRIRSGGVIMSDGRYHVGKGEQEELDRLAQSTARIELAMRAQEDETAMFRGSDYWLRRANELERKRKASRSGYGGMMQGGTAFREVPEFTEQDRQEWDKAREYYYQVKNAERWGSMPVDLRQKALEAAGYTTDSVLAWQDGDEAALAGMTPDQRAQLQKDQRARRNQIAAILAGAGYEPEEVIEYAARVRNAERMQQEMSGLAEDVTGSGVQGVARGVYGTAQSYVTNLLSPIGSVGLLAQKLFRGGAGAEQYRPVDYNTPSMYFSQGTSTIRGAVGGQMGDVGRFFYDTVNSAVDSGVRMLVGQALGGGFKISPDMTEEAAEKLNRFVSGFISTQMSGEVFANSFVQAKENGSTDADALLDSVTAALIEGLTEKYSVESILSNPNGLTWTALRNSFLSEGSEEMASDFLNTIYDELKNGDDSELRTQYRELLAGGAMENDAFNQVFGDYVKQVVLDGLAGGLSGIAMSGAAEYMTNKRYEAAYADPADTQALLDEARAVNPDSKLLKRAEQRVAKGRGITGYQARELMGHNEEKLSPLKQASEKYGKQSGAMQATYQEGQDVAQYDMSYRVAYEMGKAGAKLSAAQTSEATGYLTDAQKQAAWYAGRDARTQLSDVSEVANGRALLNGQIAQVQTISEQDGKLMAEVRQGESVQTVALDSLKVDAGTRTLAEGAKQYGSAAGTVFEQYKAGQDVAAYLRAADVAAAVGMASPSASSETVLKNLQAGQLGKALSGEQITAIYKAGQTAGRAQLRKTGMTRLGTGTVTFEQTAKGAKLNERQKASVQFIRDLAKVTGIDFTVYQSSADSTGRLQGANGAYRDGTVHVDLNAGAAYEGKLENASMLRTVSHELTHYMAEAAQTEFSALQDFMVQRLSQWEGHSIQDLVEGKMATAEQAGHPITAQEALEEVVADGCEMMLRDSKAVQQLAQENQTLFQKVKNWMKKFFESLRKAFEGVEAVHPESIHMMENYAGELQKLWDEAFTAAVKNAKESGQKNSARAGAETSYSIRNTSKLTLKEQLKRFYDGEMMSSDAFYFGETPVELSKAGLDSVPLAFTIRDFRKSTSEKHNVPRRVLNNLRANLAAPLFTFGKNGEVGIVTADIDGDGKPLLVAVHANETMDRQPVNAIKSVYGLDHPAEWIGNQITEGKTFTLFDKKRANAFLQTYGYSASVGDGIRSLNGTIAQDKGESQGERFSMRTSVEETRDLIAVHNLTEENLASSLNLGGLPSPSIAIVKAEQGHSKYGPISIVFDKSTIDPQADSRNKIYGSDAWTPTVPRVEYQVNSKMLSQIERELHRLAGDTSLAGGIFGNSSVLRSMGIDDTSNLNRKQLAEKLASTDTVRAAYLADQGQTLEPVKMDKVWDKFGNDTLQKVIDRLGVDTLAEMEANLEVGESAENALGKNAEVIRDILRDYYRKQGEAMLRRMAVKKHWTAAEISEKRQTRIDNSIANVSVFTLEDIVRHAWEMYQDGGNTKGEIDRLATSEALRSAVDDHAVEEWIAGKLDGLLGKAGIYNGKDRYTPSGNSRSFAQLHYDYTLENIVRAMNGLQQARGEGIWGASAESFVAVGTPDYRSIDEVRADKGRLREATEEEYDALKAKLDPMIEEIITGVRSSNKAHSDNQFEEIDIIGSLLLDAAKGTKTKAAIRSVFRKNGYTISDALIARAQSLYSEAAKMPTKYFEAKPQRAVSFDEAKAIIVPDNTSAALVQRLEQGGANVVSYKAGDEQARLEALNAQEGVKFSERDSTPNVFNPDGKTIDEQLDDVLNTAESFDGRYLYIGRFTQEFVDLVKPYLEVRDLPIVMNYRDAYLAMANKENGKYRGQGINYHNLGKEGLKQAIEAFAAPDAVMQSKKNGKVELVLDGTDYKGNRFLAIVALDTSTRNVDRFIKAHVVTSVYGRRSIDNYIRKASEDGRLVYDKREEPARGISQVQYKSNINADSSLDANVSQTGSAVKWQERDTVSAEIATLQRDLRQMRAELKRLKGSEGQVDLAAAAQYDAREALRAAKADAKEAREQGILAGQMAQGRQDAKAMSRLEAKLAQERAAGAEGREALRTANRDIRARDKTIARNDAAIQRLQDRIARTEERLNDRIAEQRQRLKDYRENRNETEAARRQRAQIEARCEELTRMLTQNNDKQHIPEPLKQPVKELLEALTPSRFSQPMQERGTETQADARLVRSLEKIRRVAADQAQGKLSDLGYLDLPPEFLDDIDDIFRFVSDGQTEPLYAMNSAQLKELNQVLTVLTTSIKQINRLITAGHFESVRDAAEATALDLDSMRERKLHFGLDSKAGKAEDVLRNFLSWKNTTPYYAFRRFGEGGQDMFRRLADGWDRLAFNSDRIIRFAEDTYTEQEVKAWEKEKHTLKTEAGRELTLTTAQAMELYELSKREQAQGHLYGGGIRISGQGIRPVLLTVADVEDAAGLLSERQKAVADKLQQYMEIQGSAWGNEVSMERFGYRYFTEPHYYPVVSDSNELIARDTEAQENSMFRLLNLSATKGLREGANNAIVIGSIFDTFANHMSDMAKYNALALPILDTMKWFNYRDTVKNGAGQLLTQNVKQSIEAVYGSDALRYFTTFIKDLNGVSEGGRGEGFANKMISNYKVAAVAANLRVALLQPTAYVRAANVIAPKYLTIALKNAPKALWNASGNVFRGSRNGLTGEMLEHSGIALWKSLGFYDTNIGRGVREQIKNAAGIKEKVVEKSMSLAELGDTSTWTVIWSACKLEQQDRGYSGDELLERTAERFREVVYATQVVDSTMTRSHMMRSKSTFSKLSTAFMSEPTLSYNMLLDAAMGIQEVNRRGGNGWKAQGGKLLRAFTVFASTAAASALVESLSDAFRDDDDEDAITKFINALFGEKLLDGNLGQNLLPIDSLPYLKDAVSILQGYSNERMDTEFISKIVNAAKIWAETYKLETGELDKATKVTSYGSMTTWGKVYKTLDALSSTAGLPLAATTREVTSIWNATIGAISPRMKIKRYESKDQKLEWLYSFAQSGSKADYEKELEGLRKTFPGGNTGEEITESIQDGLRGKIKDHYLDGDLTEQEAQRLIERYTGRDAEEAEDDVNRWHYQRDTGDTDASASMAAAWYGIAEPAGIDRETFAAAWAFHNDVEGDKDSSGKTVPGSKKQKVVDYIQGLGLSREQEKALWDALKGNWKDTDTPWE